MRPPNTKQVSAQAWAAALSFLVVALILIAQQAKAQAQVIMVAPQPAYPSSYVVQPGPFEAVAGAQSNTVLVLGVYGPNTQAVCQAGSAGPAYYNCRQLISYDLRNANGAITGTRRTNTETAVSNDGRLAAQPSGSFYGARGYVGHQSGEASSFCQHQNLYGGETGCIVDAGSSAKSGAWAKIYFKRSGN